MKAEDTPAKQRLFLCLEEISPDAACTPLSSLENMQQPW